MLDPGSHDCMPQLRVMWQAGSQGVSWDFLGCLTSWSIPHGRHDGRDQVGVVEL